MAAPVALQRAEEEAGAWVGSLDTRQLQEERDPPRSPGLQLALRRVSPIQTGVFLPAAFHDFHFRSKRVPAARLALVAGTGTQAPFS